MLKSCLTHKRKALLALGLALSIHGLIIKTTHAQTSSVDATVKLSVCGNSVVEGGEDCEGLDLDGQTCKSQGYGGGTLSCDVSCAFNFTECLPPTPMPTPSPTSSHSPMPTSSVTSDNSSGNSAESNDNSNGQMRQGENTEQSSQASSISVANLLNVIRDSVTQITTPQQQQASRLLPLNILSEFDKDGDNEIKQDELEDLLMFWTDEWRRFLYSSFSITATENSTNIDDLKCDVNGDSICNLVDFSVIIYYVE